MICKNPGLFKFWADSQFPSNLPSFPLELLSFPLSLYWTNSVFTVISYALASHSRTLSIFLVHGGCPPASITQKRPNHGQPEL